MQSSAAIAPRQRSSRLEKPFVNKLARVEILNS
jgi:hypothetical protein